MRSGKWKRSLFIAAIVVSLAVDCWGADSFVIPAINDGGAYNRLYATSSSVGSSCEGLTLNFHKTGSWNSTDLHMWGEGYTFQLMISIVQDGPFNSGANFNVTIYENGDAKVCVNNAIRWLLASQLAKAELDAILVPAGLSSGKFIKTVVNSATYFITATGIVFAPEAYVAIEILANATVAASLTPAVVSLIEEYLPEADAYIEDHLFLCYHQEYSYTDPCASPDYSYVKYQVKPGLIDPFWDYICKNSQPNQSVE